MSFIHGTSINRIRVGTILDWNSEEDDLTCGPVSPSLPGRPASPGLPGGPGNPVGPDDPGSPGGPYQTRHKHSSI